MDPLEQELHSQPYHRFLKSLGQSYERLLKWPGPAVLPGPLEPGADARSTVYILDIDSANQIRRHQIEVAPYDIHAATQVQSILRDKTSDTQARVICVQTVLPAILEALGPALDLQPKLFLQHIGHTWSNLLVLNSEARVRPVFERSMVESVSRLPTVGDGTVSLSVDFPRYITRDGGVSRLAPNFPARGVRLSPEDGIKQGLHSKQYRWRHPDEWTITRGGPELNRGMGEGSADTIHHFTLHCATHDQVATSIIFFPPCFEGRFDSFSGDEVLHATPMRPKDLEQSYSHYAEGMSVVSHVQKHRERRDKADLEAFVDELSSEIRPGDDYDPSLPWLISYRFSLGQWQDLVHRLQARYTYAVETLNKQDKKRYSHSLKRWILSCLTCLSDVIHGLKVAQITFNRFYTLSSSPTYVAPLTQAPGSFRLEFNMLLIQYEQIDRSLYGVLALVNESIRINESDLQTEVAHTNILNSKESIAEAKSVRSLTALAFIWIPISAVSSVFGTNTKELSTDRQPSIWVFVLVAAVVTCITLLGVWVHREHAERIEIRLRRYYMSKRLGAIVTYGWVRGVIRRRKQQKKRTPGEVSS